MLRFRRKMFDMLLINRWNSAIIIPGLTLENPSTLLFLLLFFRHKRCLQKLCTKFCTDFWYSSRSSHPFRPSLFMKLFVIETMIYQGYRITSKELLISVVEHTNRGTASRPYFFIFIPMKISTYRRVARTNECSVPTHVPTDKNQNVYTFVFRSNQLT